MGKRSREKRERRERGEIIAGRERPEIRPVFILKGIILLSTFLILFTPLIGPPLTNNFFFPFVGPKSLYFMGLAELAFFAWLILILIDKRFLPKFNLLLLTLILFLVIFVASALAGVDLSYSFWSKFERMTGILMMGHLLAFFLVISSTFEKKDWEKIFAVSLFVGVLIGFIASASKNPTMRGGGTIGNDSFLGTYLLFNLFFALYLILKSRESLRVYSTICFLLISLFLLFSGAKAAKFSFLGGLILLFFLWLILCQKGKLKTLGISLLSLSIVFGLIFAIFAFQPESFVRKGLVERFVGVTFGGRFVVWQKAWESFLQKPVLGWGPENFEFAFIKNYNSCMGTERCGGDVWYDRAHNIIFDTLVSLGILGMLFYILIFLVTLYLLWKNYFQKKNDFWFASIFTILLICYSVQNLTVFDMVSSYMIFFLTLGFIANPHTYAIGVGVEDEVTKPVKSPPFFLLFFLAILFLVSFTKFVILPLQSDAYTISALRAQPFSEERLLFYKKTLSASPVAKYQIREFFADSSIGSLTENIPLQNVQREFDFLVEQLEKSIRENSINYRAYLKLGQLLNVYARINPEKLAEAEEILKEAIEISPKNQQGYWSLAQTKIQQGDFKSALSSAEKAVELEPNLERSHIIVIKIAQWMGDSELAEKKIKEALSVNSAWEKDLKEFLGEK